MTSFGFVVSNDKFVRIRDELGTVNLAGDEACFREEEIKIAVQTQQYVTTSLNIPDTLIIRSLPVNVELMEVIRAHQTSK